MGRHQFRDPAGISGPRGILSERLGDPPLWRYCDLEDMNAKFADAMEAAGFQLTAVSTSPGTRAPRSGYERP
jgi:hypothetical protein